MVFLAIAVAVVLIANGIDLAIDNNGHSENVMNGIVTAVCGFMICYSVYLFV